jgi:hypothetical protein
MAMTAGSTKVVRAASKCEHWRSIDLADLKRMGLLKPFVGGRIKAITWKRDDGGLDQLGIIPSAPRVITVPPAKPNGICLSPARCSLRPR